MQKMLIIYPRFEFGVYVVCGMVFTLHFFLWTQERFFKFGKIITLPPCSTQILNTVTVMPYKRRQYI